jgi:hypothetical protein
LCDSVMICTTIERCVVHIGEEKKEVVECERSVDRRCGQSSLFCKPTRRHHRQCPLGRLALVVNKVAELSIHKL